MPILNFGSRNSIVGGRGDTTSLTRACAMAHRYGPSSTMLTITPDDINNPSSLRLAMRHFDNSSFPATVDEEFFDKLKQNSSYTQQEGTIKIPLDYSARKKAAVSNPVAVAHEFRSVLENVVQILLGCPLDFHPGTNSKRIRTWHFQSKDELALV